MANALHSFQKDTLLVILWGLIFTKCFTFEFLVQTYSVPINSVLYVWSLSIFMALAATYVFLRLKIQNKRDERSISPSSWSVWIACLIAGLIATSAAFGLQSFDIYLLPALLALLLGFGYVSQGFIYHLRSHMLSGFGWWFGAAILFRFKEAIALLLFGLFILCFTVIPAFIHMVRQRREMSSAVEALKQPQASETGL